MAQKTSKLLSLALCFSGFTATFASAQDGGLILMHNDLAPYVVNNEGTVSGFIADYLNAAATQAGISVIWQDIQWERQLPILKRNQKNMCGVGYAKTPERESYMRFTAPIGIDEQFVLIGRKASTRLLKHDTYKSVLADILLTPILQIDTVYSDYINNLLREKSFEKVEGSLLRLARSVSAGNHDYMLTTAIVAEQLLTKETVGDQLKIYDHYQDLAGNHEYYVACSLSTDTDLFKKFNAAIKKAGIAKRP